ncbi:triose-phosphate isomerase [Thalassotalea nanhaiensis]|uniref:Triosephosphate isomerase n=1 Tax=Thalassotalea nanhaiensis TaxID=3065648 RepID=A0ABY9TMI9_9GAMM|nr:triose-phosphate isomerase [Colwelliaceae bacterium SQ345]
MSRQTIVAANWKMNGNAELAAQMCRGLNDEKFNADQQVIICPPAPYLALLQANISNSQIACGAQNINENEKGAFTGEISALMLNDLQVQYVILGHSERRAMFHDSTELVAEKVAYALDSGLTPILCIGETLEEREDGETESRLSYQLAPVIAKVGIESFKNVVVAYEPVWAIGTGKTASAEIAQQTHEFIRSYLASFDADVAQQVPLLYGGSVNAKNCEELFAQADIDGGLIGGASLNVEEFKKICQAV